MVTSGGVPARSHGVTTGMGSAPPCVCSGGELDAGHELETCRPSAACPGEHAFAEGGLGEASLRDSDKHACGACRCDSPRARMAARFADSSTGAGYGPVPTGHREVRYPYLERGPRKGEAPAVVGKLQGLWRPINRSLIERMNHPIGFSRTCVRKWLKPQHPRKSRPRATPLGLLRNPHSATDQKRGRGRPIAP